MSKIESELNEWAIQNELLVKEFVFSTFQDAINFVNEVAAKNVEMTIDNIRANSQVLSELEQQGEIKIIGGMYDIKTGGVTFYE